MIAVALSDGSGGNSTEGYSGNRNRSTTNRRMRRSATAGMALRRNTSGPGSDRAHRPAVNRLRSCKATSAIPQAAGDLWLCLYGLLARFARRQLFENRHHFRHAQAAALPVCAVDDEGVAADVHGERRAQVGCRPAEL